MEMLGEFWWTIRRTDGSLEMYWDGDNRILSLYQTKEAAQERINETVDGWHHTDGNLRFSGDRQMKQAHPVRILIQERPDEPKLL